jgi:uncharacterized protein DUF4160
MYWRERDHPIPHFHAEQAGDRASIAFDGTVIAGELPTSALRFVREWAALHGDELLANWERARKSRAAGAHRPASLTSPSI